MAHINAEPFLVRREDYVNQFRVQFTDEYGRRCDHTFQVGEPVFHSHEGVIGYTTIKDISVAGVFTVYAAPQIIRRHYGCASHRAREQVRTKARR